MKPKIYNVLLLLSFQFGYLEWGTNQHQFVFQAQFEIITKAFSNFMSVVHPFTVLPFLGECLLVLTLFQKNAHRKLTMTGVFLLGFFMLLLLLIGLASLKIKIILSVLPFWIVFYLIWKNKTLINE
ncbi:MAG: hypothetical protein JST78_08655 [Bacteroidetes bacterium]|nr:hypothetical protein [Bacteroidota bacterium]